PVTLEILDGDGELVRRYASDDPPEPPLEGQNVPDYWPRPWQPLRADAGMHRFVWDVRYARPDVLRFGYPISAIPHYTPAEPRGPVVLPGTYTVRLTVDGQLYEQPLTVKMDPRVTTSPAEIARAHELSMRLYRAIGSSFAAMEQVQAFRADPANAARERDAAQLEAAFRGLNGTLGGLFRNVDGVDAGPTSQTVAAAGDALRALDEAFARWRALSGQ
ncbi:MAG: glycoside hydrolase, partial [Acidobacteriota bacterium]